MDKTEEIAKRYLTSCGFSDVVYEPDGNVPPDFLLDGKIAVEVRRLNQHEDTNGVSQGLEVSSIPLWQKMEKLVTSVNSGAPYRQSAFVTYTYSRPIPPWADIESFVREWLINLQNGLAGPESVLPTRRGYFELAAIKSSNRYDTPFIMGGCSDHDAGGFVISELKRNLEIVIREKSLKIARYRAKYNEWWLLLVDHIAYSLDADDRQDFREVVAIEHDWNKIVLINPLNAEQAFEILERSEG